MIISVEDLTVNYDKSPAIYGITVDIPAHKITGIIGPNGSGKTTLLKSILGLLPRQGGSVKIKGLPWSQQTRDIIAYVPQKDEVDWNCPILVKEAVAMGRYRPGKFLGRLNNYDWQITEESMQKLGLLHLARRPISHLSGGEQQRIFLARALAREAEIYILDEPFVGVDATTEKMIIAYLLELKEEGKTVIMVHHRLEDLHIFDWIILLNRKLIGAGPLSEVMNSGLISHVYGDNHGDNHRDGFTDY